MGLAPMWAPSFYGRAPVCKDPLSQEAKREVDALANRGRYLDAVTRASLVLLESYRR